MATWPVASPNTHPDRSPARGQGRTRLGEGVDDQRLPGPGRADQGLDPGAEGEQAADRGGLVFPQPDPHVDQVVEEPLRQPRRHGGVAGGGRGEKGASGVHVLRGGGAGPGTGVAGLRTGLPRVLGAPAADPRRDR